MLKIMPRKRSARTHLVLLATCVVVSIPAFGVGIMTFDNFSCRTGRDRNDEFLAYCRSVRYVDYEHGALYYGLEPKLRESIRSAQVLFLGSSRLQAAFAANAVRDYFRARDVRYFVMGFGYGEGSAFAQPVMERSRASPQIVVINADPFFIEGLSPPARDAIEGNPGYLLRLVLKTAFQRVHRAICRAAPLCPESEPSIFRSATDGQWNWVGPYTNDRAVPIGEEIKERLPQDQIEHAKIIGEAFLRRLGIPRQCVVFTGIPNSDLNSAEIAQALAAALHTQLVAAKVDGLATLDGAHLNSRSAELWSAAFLHALTPIIDQCLVH
jgi:hypothetical protein